MARKKIGLSSRKRKYLLGVGASGMSNRSYRKAIDIFERYRKRFDIGENLDHLLGTLYDHLAVKTRSANKSRFYLQKAEMLYRELLKKNPKNLFAFYGMGRIALKKGEKENALKYAMKARKERNALPVKQRGALLIAYICGYFNELKRAEMWYKRDIQEIGKPDFGSWHNLFSFYVHKRQDYAKAAKMIPQLEQLIQEEFSKKHYRGMRMLESNYIKNIRKEIDLVKQKLAGK